MEDEQIVDLFFRRDQGALRETERKYNRYLYAVAHRILGNHEDSEECVNDALLSAWNIPLQRLFKGISMEISENTVLETASIDQEDFLRLSLVLLR